MEDKENTVVELAKVDKEGLYRNHIEITGPYKGTYDQMPGYSIAIKCMATEKILRPIFKNETAASTFKRALVKFLGEFMWKSTFPDKGVAVYEKNEATITMDQGRLNMNVTRASLEEQGWRRTK